MAKLIEKKVSETIYNIDLTEDDLHIILTVYGFTSYDYYKEKAVKYNYKVLSDDEFRNLHSVLWSIINNTD